MAELLRELKVDESRGTLLLDGNLTIWGSMLRAPYFRKHPPKRFQEKSKYIDDDGNVIQMPGAQYQEHPRTECGLGFRVYL